MNCGDVQAAADSPLAEKLAVETNQEILRHLETCSSCGAEIDARRRVRAALRRAFNDAPGLRPRPEFGSRLREQLRQSAIQEQRSRAFPRRWLTVAAGVVLAAGLGSVLVLHRSIRLADALASDAIGDHR